AAGRLFGRRFIGDEVDETRVHAFEGGGLRIGDVAGNVFERERLRAQTRHCGGESAKDTHDLIPNSVPGGRPEGTLAARSRCPSQTACQHDYVFISML